MKKVRFNLIMQLCFGLLLATTASFAFREEDPSPLETPKTYYDQGGVWKYQGDNMVVDTRDGRIQSVSQLYEGPFKGTPEQAAREFLSLHQDWVGFEPTELNLKQVRVAESASGIHVTFERIINGVPVYPGNMVISMDRENNVLFYFSSLYVFKDAVNTSAGMTARSATETAKNYLHAAGESYTKFEPQLVVWAGDNRDFAVCWKIKVDYPNSEPVGDWEILVDANSGSIRRVQNLLRAVDGTGFVFEPDPLGSSGASYGNAGYTDNNNADSPQLTAQRFSRTLRDISDVFAFPIHIYTLNGPYCRIQNIQAPNTAPVSQANNLTFNYTRSQTQFEDCQCYYDIDQSQRWIQSLGFFGIQNGTLPVDPHAESGDCNAHYWSGNYLTFGEGNPDVDAAEEASIILHEYGHAINAAIVSGWGAGGDEGSMGEGWGDYWGESYATSVAAFPDDYIGHWGLHNCFGGRTLHANLHYPEDNNIEVHYSGQIWSQALYEAERGGVGRFVMNKVGLDHQYYIGNSASMLTAAQAVVTSTIALNYGYALYAISDAFVPRGLLARPSNDVCSGANYILSVPYATSGTTALANNDYTNCMSNISPEVMYALYLPCATSVTASLCGSGYDTGITVNTGGSCPGTTNVACNDDNFAACGGSGLQSQVTFTANANTYYYILVHGFSTWAGGYNLNVTGTKLDAVPSNDQCAGSIPITSVPYANSGQTCGADYSTTHCSGTSPDVFYSVTLPTCQTVTASLCGSGYDTRIDVRTGGGCPGSTFIDCNDDYCSFQSQVSFVAQANVTYYLIVSGFLNDFNSGPYTLNVTGVPYTAPNDHCAGSTVIASLPYTDNGNTLCATNDRVNCIGPSSNDVFYTYTAPSDCHNVYVSLCGSNFDTAIEVRAGGICPGDYLIACNDDACGLQSRASFNTVAGMNYFIIVHGFYLAAGAFTMSVTDSGVTAPSNDLCTGAAPIIYTFPFSTLGTTVCANNDYTGTCIGALARDVVYHIYSYSCKNITVSLCGSNYDTGLYVKSGPACGGTTQVACNDDNGIGACPANNLASQVSFNAEQYTDYWVYVDGYGSNSGMYIINMTAQLCSPDSLVIQRWNATNDIRLDWTSVATYFGNYNVYRSTTLPVPTDNAHLIGTTTDTTYYDVNAVNNAGVEYYYAVNASSYTLQDDPDRNALDAMEQQQMEAKKNILQTTDISIPAYIDPSHVETPNPQKLAEALARQQVQQQPRRYKLPTEKTQ